MDQPLALSQSAHLNRLKMKTLNLTMPYLVVHPSYKLINPTYPTVKTRDITYLVSGMSHQVAIGHGDPRQPLSHV